MKQYYYKLGNELGDARRASGLSQKQVAELVGCAMHTISNYECGRPGNVPINRLIKLCDVLEIDFMDIVEEMKEEVAACPAN